MLSSRSLVVVLALCVLTLQKTYLEHTTRTEQAGATLQLIRHNDRFRSVLSRRDSGFAKRQNIPQSILQDVDQDGAYSAIVFIGTPPQVCFSVANWNQDTHHTPASGAAPNYRHRVMILSFRPKSYVYRSVYQGFVGHNQSV